MLIQIVSVHQQYCYVVDGGPSHAEPVNKADDTPLSLACANGHLDTVKYLVNEHHCDPSSKHCMTHQLLHHFSI